MTKTLPTSSPCSPSANSALCATRIKCARKMYMHVRIMRDLRQPRRFSGNMHSQRYRTVVEIEIKSLGLCYSENEWIYAYPCVTTCIKEKSTVAIFLAAPALC